MILRILIIITFISSPAFAISTTPVDDETVNICTDDGRCANYTIPDLNKTAKHECKEAVKASQKALIKQESCLFTQSLSSRSNAILNDYKIKQSKGKV